MKIGQLVQRAKRGNSTVNSRVHSPPGHSLWQLILYRGLCGLLQYAQVPEDKFWEKNVCAICGQIWCWNLNYLLIFYNSVIITYIIFCYFQSEDCCSALLDRKLWDNIAWITLITILYIATHMMLFCSTFTQGWKNIHKDSWNVYSGVENDGKDIQYKENSCQLQGQNGIMPTQQNWIFLDQKQAKTEHKNHSKYYRSYFLDAAFFILSFSSAGNSSPGSNLVLLSPYQ